MTPQPPSRPPILHPNSRDAELGQGPAPRHPGTTRLGTGQPRYRRCRDRRDSTLRRGSRHWDSPRCPRRSPRRRGCCRCHRRRSGRVLVSTHPCRCMLVHPVRSFQFGLGETGQGRGSVRVGDTAAAPRTALLLLSPFIPLAPAAFLPSSVSHQPIAVTQEKHHNKLPTFTGI